VSGGTGVAFTLGSAAVIVAGWVILLLGSRGTTLRKQARMPPEERSFRLSIEGDRVRLAGANGHAHEFPASEISQAKLTSAGLLLDVRSQVYFVPTRALRDNEADWRTFAERAPAWTLRFGFTIALWCFAFAVGAYGFFA
jgi:hypothetical protein